MRDASAEYISDPKNWTGSYYELALEMGERNDERLEAALRMVWATADVEGCFAPDEAGKHVAVDCNLDALLRYGHLRGKVKLPGGLEAVCGVVVVREDVEPGFYGPDWLDFYLPMVSLSRADDRVGAYWRGDLEDSLSWRRPIDDWLAGVAKHVYEAAPFKLGLIGEETSGMAYSDRLQGGIPEDRPFAYLVPERGQLAFYPATV